MDRNKVGAVLLAAGTSSRMGTAKQLLQLQKKTLLETVLDQVLTHPFEKVYVVLGHRAEEIKNSVATSSEYVRWIDNPNYKEGQSTSILKAMNSLDSSVDSVMFFLTDQPFIRSNTVSKILTVGCERMRHDSNPFVIRPTYKNKPGHPVFWGNVSGVPFSQLSGDSGGKEIMHLMQKELVPVSDRYVLFDIDTPDDYKEAQLHIKRATSIHKGGH
ncbi:nucleotidyltransferase family protein [Alkalihalobacillus sp. MEB130]|uniref:nucleotidyltransferase family protein n=1 Tax=Alkalihalobacillus sp. MEB130 TaxID=2976704 RepID=UPI0028DD8461|nr:nucleotidyltransferase family protein [Alkalihalobacillus sp. MEB130]MDT8860883.1 nucleotidyltransferase family protein [Alkalihalobacillus sp. MEB130]